MSSRLSVPVALRWSDMDALRHVNNVQFLRLLEEARIAAVGAWFGREGARLGGFVVARQEIEYVAQLAYRREPIVVDCWVSDIGGASFTVAYEVRDGAPGPDDAAPEGPGADAGPGPEEGSRPRVYARAETTLVAFDFDTQRPYRLDEAERAALAGVLGEAPPLRRRPARGSDDGGTDGVADAGADSGAGS